MNAVLESRKTRTIIGIMANVLSHREIKNADGTLFLCAMLQRQQAAAIIDARQKIVEGAVGILWLSRAGCRLSTFYL